MKKNMMLLRSLLIVSVLAFSLFGCGKDTVKETTVEETAQQEIVENPEREIIKEVKNEDGSTTIFYKQKPVTDEEKAIQEWVQSMEDEKTRVALWNTETDRKEILQIGARYPLEKGDKIILCYCSSTNKFNTTLAAWGLQEVNEYLTDGKYYTELKYDENLEDKEIQLILNHVYKETYEPLTEYYSFYIK